VCGSGGAKRSFPARETMYGTKEEFEYLECLECGSLQIKNVPKDLSRFYPDDYYLLTEARASVEPLSWPRAFLRGARTNYYIGRWNLIGWLVDKIKPNYFKMNWEWFTHSRVSTKSRILDVGCGTGNLLRNMYAQGFQWLTGIDPHTKEPFCLPGLRILKGRLDDLTERFDFIMLHHSLEHMPDPVSALRAAQRHLRRGGHVLVRLPVTGTYGWRHYGLNWIGLDPPRHIFVPTVAGMMRLARRSNFAVVKFWFDTTDWNLLMSEKQQRSIPARDRTKGFVIEGLFTPEQVTEFRKRAEDLNRDGDGDTACFILQSAGQ